MCGASNMCWYESYCEDRSALASESLQHDGRHAYLVMAHNEEAILHELLKDLDDERNDIFLHVDAKATRIMDKELVADVKKASLRLLERTDVRWGSYSQIECVHKLLAEATAQGPHDYYHFLVGTEFPLKSQDYIHDYFRSNLGTEFIGYDFMGEASRWRISLYHPFARCARPANRREAGLDLLRRVFVKVQKAVGIDRLRGSSIEIKKGNANWSITDPLARYLVEEMPRHKSMFDWSYCADELIVHTLVYNSPFIERVKNLDDEYESNMRVVQWNDEKNLYHEEDLPFLLATDKLFARKFSGREGLSLIRAIRRARQQG